MNDLYYTELREKVREMEQIRREQGDAESAKCNRDLYCVLDIMPKLSLIGIKEGLPALELEVERFDYVPCAKYLTEMILLVVMGYDSDVIESISLTRYFSGDLKGREGLIYLMYLTGILSIREGRDPYTLEQKLKAMVPRDVADAYEKEQGRIEADIESKEAEKESKEMKEKESKEKESEETDKESEEQDKDLDFSQVEELCKEEFTWDEQDPGYFVMKLADYIFINLTDRAIKYLYMKINDRGLCFALWGLSGAARRHIFINCSRGRAVLLTEEMNDMRYNRDIVDMDIRDIRKRDIVQAVQRILKTFFELCSDPFYEKIFACGALDGHWEGFFEYFAVPNGEYGIWKPDFEEFQSKWSSFQHLQNKAL